MLTARDVCFQYRDQEPFFSKVNCTIAPHTFTTIIGPNGGGKTTLLNLLMGFYTPHIGKIESTFKQIGYVPQSSTIDLEFPLRVIDHVLIGAIQQRTWWGGFNQATRAFVDEILKQLDLFSIKNLLLKELSGGQFQRAQIAHALASNPDLLILDEPTANIDPRAKQQILQLLTKLKSKMALVMVTHDLETLSMDTDQVLLVSNGIESVDKNHLCRHTSMGLYETPLSIAKNKRDGQ